MKQWLEMEIGITGGEEDGVVCLSCIYRPAIKLMIIVEQRGRGRRRLCLGLTEGDQELTLLQNNSLYTQPEDSPLNCVRFP